MPMLDLTPDELAPLVVHLRERLGAHGRSADAVTVSLRKGVLVRNAEPAAERPLYGDRDTIRRDLNAYRRAGLDYLVANLRQAKSADDLAAALADVAGVLTS